MSEEWQTFSNNIQEPPYQEFIRPCNDCVPSGRLPNSTNRTAKDREAIAARKADYKRGCCSILRHYFIYGGVSIKEGRGNRKHNTGV